VLSPRKVGWTETSKKPGENAQRKEEKNASNLSSGHLDAVNLKSSDRERKKRKEMDMDTKAKIPTDKEKCAVQGGGKAQPAGDCRATQNCKTRDTAKKFTTKTTRKGLARTKITAKPQKAKRQKV